MATSWYYIRIVPTYDPTPAAFRQRVRDHIRAAGYDPDRVLEETILQTWRQDTLEAGRDYDPFYQYSRPGDVTSIKRPPEMTFEYLDDGGGRHFATIGGMSDDDR